MLRSLYSGISGLRAHQTLMDVVGNNIANVNTTGYKSSSVEFQDTLSQVVSSAGKPNSATGQGGVNATEVGLGVKVAGTSTSWTQGAAQLTGKNTDMMISGDGFFVTKSADGTTSYTRDGSFGTDALGQLTSVDGSLLQGWAADATGNVNSNAPIGTLAIPVTGTVGAPAATTKLTLSGNLPNNYSTNTTGNANVIGPVATTVYDALGTASTMYVQYTHSTTNNQTWTVSTASTSAMTGATTQTLNFGTDGKPNTTAGGAPATDIKSIAAGTAPSYALDVSNLTGYSGQTGSTGTATSSTITISGQDGAAAGAITAFNIGSDGTITASFDNGLKKILGQIAVAAFTNPSGLIKAGSSSYVTSSNSGNANVGTAGTGGRGQTTSGELEMSNVDLSQEFTNLIVAQRGFQANSRIITASDQLLQTLVQMGQ